MPGGQLAPVAAARSRALRSSASILRCAASQRAGLAQVPLDALVDRGVHEHREDHRRRAVDRHRHRRGRRAQVEAGIQLLHVVERRDRDARVADACRRCPAAGPDPRRTASSESNAVDRRVAGVAAREVVEAPVGALRARPRPRTCASGPRPRAGTGYTPPVYGIRARQVLACSRNASISPQSS